MELRKNIDIQSFYNSVQRLEGHTLISALKKEDINSVINSAKKEIESFFELVRNDFTQRTASDELYNPLFMLKLWDLARTESINYLQKKDKNKCSRVHDVDAINNCNVMDDKESEGENRSR